MFLNACCENNKILMFVRLFCMLPKFTRLFNFFGLETYSKDFDFIFIGYRWNVSSRLTKLLLLVISIIGHLSNAPQRQNIRRFSCCKLMGLQHVVNINNIDNRKGCAKKLYTAMFLAGQRYLFVRT